MRIALALATAVAGSLIGVAGVAAPAQAAECHSPQVHGYHVSRLTTHHATSCDTAHQVVHAAFRTGHQLQQLHRTCRHDTFDRRYFFFSCWGTNGSGHWLTFDATYA